MSDILIVIGVCLVILLLFGSYGYHLLKQQQKIINQLQDTIVSLQKNAKQNTTTQRSVLKGQIVEQLVPLMKSCDYISSDMKFLGMPIDYIIFEGLTETRDGECYISNIIIADVKTGKASLTKEQKAIKDAIDNRRVIWKTIRIE